MPATAERVKDVIDYWYSHDDDDTCKTFNLTQETLARYKRKHAKSDNTLEKRKVLRQISEQYDEKELKAIARGARITPGYIKVPVVDFTGERVRFAHITDTHMGSIYFKEEYFDKALDECRKEGVEFICHSGDVTDGMKMGRMRQLFELTHVGYKAQKNYAIEQLKKWEKPWYLVSGNHDEWYLDMGAAIVEDIAQAVPNATYIGENEGDISLAGGAVVKLWHGADGSSYATSYRIQKIVEAFTGGEKPNVLLAGHVHKTGYFFERHIHCISGGAICTQSRWMRSKRMANHTGFWIIDAWIGKKSINKLTTTWYPFYA